MNLDAIIDTPQMVDVEPTIHRSTEWHRRQNKRKESIIDSLCAELTKKKSEVEHHNHIGKHVMQYLQTFQISSYRANNKIAKYLFEIFGEDHLNDNDMSEFLSKELKFTRTSRFKLILQNWKDCNYIKKPSRVLTLFVKSTIHNEWLANSVVSVDRRNGRDMARINKVEFDEKFSGIDMHAESNSNRL